MAETTADVRRDIELTRERMTSTLAQLEQKLNLTQVVRDNPWPAVGLALGAGFLLSGSGADVKAASATRSLASTTRDGTRSRLGPALDDALSRLMLGLSEAVNYQIDRVVGDVQRMLGAPESDSHIRRHLADTGDGNGAPHTGAPAGAHAGEAATSNPYTGASGSTGGGSGSWAPQSAGTDVGGTGSGQALGRAD